MSEAVRRRRSKYVRLSSACEILIAAEQFTIFSLLNWRRDSEMIFLQCYSIFQWVMGFEVFVEKVRVHRGLVRLAELS